MTTFPPALPECCLRFLGEAERRPRMRLASLLFLFDLIRDVPGDIVELGVASGESLRMWQHFIAEHGGLKRALWGFDTFAGFPSFTPEDGVEMPAIGKRVGGETEIRDRPATLEEVAASMGNAKYPDLTLVRGDIPEMLVAPKVVERFSSVALVFFDADTYAPTVAGIETFWPRLSPGGLFVFDEYGQEAWPGETKAVDDFVKKERLTLLVPGMESGPNAYVVKPS